MSVPFKNRIAMYYMIVTAIIMMVAFGFVYFIVHSTVMSHLDDDLAYEAAKHSDEIKISGDDIHFMNKAELEEWEHTVVQVYPVFIQLYDKDGKAMDKSPNLKGADLSFREEKFGGYFDEKINGRAIRQAQIPIEQDGKIKGYILTAVSSESSISVLKSLRNVLFISYLVILAGLYYISRFLAGRSILPIQAITNTITRISKNNLNERVELPQNKDEIHVLAVGFNALLDRIEEAIQRERQFTSDASHELRTPLSTLRGTLEVLIRKPRTQEEYEEKIEYSLSEIDTIAAKLEQLFLLARLDTKSDLPVNDLVALNLLIEEILQRQKKSVIEKELKIDFQFPKNEPLPVPRYYGQLIIENILSNAIKYSPSGTEISIDIGIKDDKIVCTIQDEGIGIKEEDLEHIYENFFRSDWLNHKEITGTGLGLSIVKKSAAAIQATLNIESVLGKGTTVTILF
ncbi:MAG: ATP-binding protein [Balneolaceae bacterium]